MSIAARIDGDSAVAPAAGLPVGPAVLRAEGLSKQRGAVACQGILLPGFCLLTIGKPNFATARARQRLGIPKIERTSHASQEDTDADR
jgi:hypothetical protein